MEALIISYGITSFFYSKIINTFAKNLVTLKADSFLLKNVPYTNMYGGASRGEFVLKLQGKAPIRIECRSQEVHGSVDEKLPYLLGNCISFEEKDVIIILEGGGMRPEARNYLKEVTKRSLPLGKNIKVMSFYQFYRWCDAQFINVG